MHKYADNCDCTDCLLEELDLHIEEILEAPTAVVEKEFGRLLDVLQTARELSYHLRVTSTETAFQGIVQAYIQQELRDLI